MIDLAFAIPGDIGAATGGYGYARKLLQHLPTHGVTPHHIELPAGFPDPSSEDIERTCLLLKQIHPDTPILFDGLAFGAMPTKTLMDIEASLVALVHHPLGLEPGLSAERAEALIASERAALATANSVITSSRYTARTLAADFAVPADNITIAEPGTAPAERAIGTSAPFTMLAVGSLIPRKGYGVLIDALAGIERDDWQLTIAGSAEHDPEEAQLIREKLLASGHRSRITLAGRVSGDELANLYSRADLFVMPTLYEGYGMVLTEALARGLPIVSTTGGAAAETAPDAASLKVPPGDQEALAGAIAQVMESADTRQRMSDAAWSAGQSLPRWTDTAAIVANVMKSIYEEQRA